MRDISWERYPQIAADPLAQRWLTIQANLGLAATTLAAYSHSLEAFLSFSQCLAIVPATATKAHIAAYVHEMAAGPPAADSHHRPVILANATMQLRLTAVRLFYDYLVEEGLRADNPVGRGRYTPGNRFAGARDRGLIPHYQRLPWIPSDAEWQSLLQAAQPEPLRNRLMFALAYDAALRREELCALTCSDIRPGQRLLTIRAETTKNRRSRVVPYSAATQPLFAGYLQERRAWSRARGPLFLSESRRNRAQPISIWTWSKVVHGIAVRAGVPQFTTHSLRHLRLTDLACAGWDLHEIATFAGHQSTDSTMRYIHLSGRELADKLARGMQAIHAWRLQQVAEVLQ